MDRTLLLNATYEPLRVVPWQKAILLLMKRKVEVVAAYDRAIRSVSLSVQLPSVLRLLSHVRVVRQFQHVPFSRANIYIRDKYGCQYCGRRLPSTELTFDHIIPVSRGGRKDWENIVTCCIDCNRRKGGKTPEQAGLRLLRLPRRPSFLPALRITFGATDVPETWRDYLLWHTERAR
ncbi:MAG: HNH endonuclease [Acidobacteriota bacterium]